MFRIIHISDLHISANPGTANLLDFINFKKAGGTGGASIASCIAQGAAQRSHCPDIALGASKFLAKNLLDHHIMLIGGDVATTGNDDDQKAAFVYVKDRPLAKFPYLSSAGRPTLGVRPKIAVMPGNHDRFQDKRCSANGVVFNKYFIKEWGKPGTRVRTFKVNDRATGKHLHMIAGDFCLSDDSEAFPRGYPACCGQGTVNPDTLREMCNRTSEIRKNSPNDGIIWLSHFPPSGKIVGLWPNLQLNGYPALIQEAKKHKINFVLSGHTHEDTEYLEEGVRILTAGSVCSFMEPDGNWIRSITFDVNGGVVSIANLDKFYWNSARKNFVKA